MARGFSGFPPEGIKFLRDLARNNDREWFNPRKPVFEHKVRQPMIELVAAVNREMVRFAPEYVGDPAKSISRIYRDTRFSKDKTPYKTHVAALFKKSGWGKDEGSGFFFLISPEKIELAGGLYGAMPDALFAVRQYLAENHEAFRKTYRKARVKKLLSDIYGESLSRMPKGFDPAHPAADLLRMKQWMLVAGMDGALATTPALFKEIVSRLEAVAPLVHFLNVPLEGLKGHDEARFFAE